MVDATPLSPQLSGVGFYVYNLIQSLYNLQTQENFELHIAYQPRLKDWLRGNLSFPEILKDDENLHFLPLPVRIYKLLLQVSPNLFLSNFGHYLNSPDIIHGTNYSVYPCPESLKALMLYDLTFIRYPEYVDSVAKKYKNSIRQCLEWTDLIITISENSKKDIIHCFNIHPQRIHVTPLASRYTSHYLIKKNLEQLQELIKYDFSKPYLLFVSTIEPRKNINGLIIAFNLLKQKYKIEQHLVIIGQKGWNYQRIFTAIQASSWNNQIHHLDYLSDELIALFYSKADAFVYPSHYEGFGLPVLEAMTLGAPVITSNTSSLPEVVGDAAVLVDPNDPTELAEAILQVISDSQLRDDLIQKGYERAKLYSWERTAKETLKAYRSLLA